MASAWIERVLEASMLTTRPPKPLLVCGIVKHAILQGVDPKLQIAQKITDAAEKKNSSHIQYSKTV
jgi:hypothetical protein